MTLDDLKLINSASQGWCIERVEIETRRGDTHISLHLSRKGKRRRVDFGANDVGFWFDKKVSKGSEDH